LNQKELETNYNKSKTKFHNYIDAIKKNMKRDIYNLINITLIKNPYASKFPYKYFTKNYKHSSKIVLFIKSSCKFYLKLFYLLFLYFISLIIYKFFYKKREFQGKKVIAFDIYFVVDNIIKDGEFRESYFVGLYEVLDKYAQKYLFIPRLYGVNKNPFKLIKLFKILNKDKRDFLFEYEFLKIKDFFSLFVMILAYPFKTLRLLQVEHSEIDKLFNNELINDIAKQSLDSFTRYILGQHLSKFNNIDKIYTWSEFQVIERGFNYALRSKSSILLIASQFYIVGETYFNTVIDDLDFELQTSPHKVLVNGRTYLLERKKVEYKLGVSLRYYNIYKYKESFCTTNNVLLLGSYIQSVTAYMLECVEEFNDVTFKSHPAVKVKLFTNLTKNITIVNNNIYDLFKNTSIVISTESGTLVEAVSCGLSVIVIASQDNLTANPLVEFGKGKIWDIAFSKDDVVKLYNNLIEYRNNNKREIQEIASWYRDNFFVEPTEENIVKVFELNLKGKIP